MKKSSKKLVRNVMLIAAGIGIMFIGSEIIFGTANPFYVVSSGSMIPAISVYDVIVVKENIPFDHIKVGDVIAFKSPTTNEIIVHRVAQILDQNPLKIRTKGDANQNSIPGIDLPITKSNYLGTVTYVIPQIGHLTWMLIPPMNYLVLAITMGIMTVRQVSKRN
ncbi:MAG TPA: signal peptidase I [Nitrosopumilaceae archaeon]|nr:signal peptidase I [Nitrosopumilaceae archaeon]